ncbi:MAG: LemA family protein [Gemmatimonadetes bacterium]|nr:LemA family protein [Gemmatimonadota bacterium]
MDPIVFVIGAALVPLIWAVVTYNHFIALREHIKSSASGIDVELKRRHELIPNLVNVVRGYAEHERATFDAVVKARNAAVAAMARGPSEGLAAKETELMRGLRGVFAIGEAYPALKADQRYADLQRQLADTEDRIAAVRRLYNGNIRDWRALRDAFPALIIARTFGLVAYDPAFFELASDAERVVPRVTV